MLEFSQGSVQHKYPFRSYTYMHNWILLSILLAFPLGIQIAIYDRVTVWTAHPNFIGLLQWLGKKPSAVGGESFMNYALGREQGMDEQKVTRWTLVITANRPMLHDLNVKESLTRHTHSHSQTESQTHTHIHAYC